MQKKKALGQFNTTKKDYILSGFESFVSGKKWVDPFAGGGDLLEWVKRNGAKDASGYDIDPNKGFPIRDTLLNPPDYSSLWVIANPPYLAENKNERKTARNEALEAIYRKHAKTDLDDLYKIAIRTICGSSKQCLGGIFIVPFNFLCGERTSRARDILFSKYKILACKAFEETVFEDTQYPVCAFVYERRRAQTPVDKDHFDLEFYPSKKKLSFQVSRGRGWVLGEDFFAWLNGSTSEGIGRWTVENIRPKDKQDDDCEDPNGVCIDDFSKTEWKGLSFKYFVPQALKNVILLKATDTGSAHGRIKFVDIREESPKDHKPVLAGLPTTRNRAHIKFDSPPSIKNQLRIIDLANERLEYFREKYNSVFLPTFKNSSELYTRKQLGFDLAYRILKKVMFELGIVKKGIVRPRLF